MKGVTGKDSKPLPTCCASSRGVILLIWDRSLSNARRYRRTCRGNQSDSSGT